MTRDLRTLNERVQRDLDRALGRVEQELTRIYAQAREEAQRVIARTYERYAVDGVLTRAEMTKYNRMTRLEKQLNKILGKGQQRARATVKRLTGEQVNESFFRHAWAIEQNVGAQMSWGAVSQDVIRAAVENDLQFIALDRLRQAGRERIRREIASGLVRGDSYPQMAKAIRGAINGTRSDAVRIARTEGGRAQVIGAQASYDRAEELGVEGRQRWVATLDDRTRDRHAALDGEFRDEEHEGWRVPGSNTWTPGPMQSGIASFDINCRCTTEMVVEGLEPELRRVRDEGVQPYQTYDEWKEGA